MPDIEYTASVQMATEAVARYILGAKSWPYSREYSEWPPPDFPRPNWLNFTWFTKTSPGRIRVQPRNQGRVEDLRRVVKFLLGKDVVVEVTLVGSRCPRLLTGDEHPQAHTYWAVRRVRYRLNWMPTGVKPNWVTRDLDPKYHILTNLMDCVLPAAD